MTDREEHIYLLASAKTRVVAAVTLLRETVQDLQIVADVMGATEALEESREALRKAMTAQTAIFAAFDALKETS